MKSLISLKNILFTLLDIIVISLQVRFTMMTNRLLNFAKKILPDNVYSKSWIKSFITAIGIIFVINMKTLYHILYLLLLVSPGIALAQAGVHGGFSALLATEGTAFYGLSLANVTRYMLTIWFILSFIGSPYAGATVDGADHSTALVMARCFRVNHVRYIQSRILADLYSAIVLSFLFVVAALLIVGYPLWLVIPIYIAFVAFRLTGEAINLWTFSKFGLTVSSTMTISLIGITVLCLFAVITPYFWGTFSWNPFLLLLSTPFGVASLIYIIKYPLYSEFLADKLQRQEIMYEKAKEYNSAGSVGGVVPSSAKDWSKNLDTNQLATDKHENKRGFDYLNAIFFDRHRPYLKHKLMIRLAAALLPLPLAIIGIIFLDDAGYSTQMFDRLPPLFVLAIYLASMGRIVTASVFSNCDIHMLHYPYYRTAKTILASFKSRFKVILLLNFMLTTVLSVTSLAGIWLVFGYLDIVNAVVFFAALSFIGVFFSFNDLFLYYVIQPYDEAGKGKSTVYTIINWVVYLLAWVNFNLQVDLVPYAAVLGLVTVVYVVVGVVMLVRFAPGRFRLR